jgi:PAS domain-containing protein
MDISHLIILADFGASAAAIGLALTAASVAASMYQMSNQPDAPGVNTNAEGIRTSAKLLPLQRQMSAAAQQGGTILRQGYQRITPEYARQRLAEIESDKWALLTSEKLQSEASAMRRAISTNQPVYMHTKTGRMVSENKAYADFTGFGEADVQGKIAEDYADLMIELGDKYGQQFVEEARKQLELSDPEGMAAREKMGQMIEQQAEETPERPVADLMEQQVGEQLEAGNRLDAMSRDVLDASLQDALRARGQTGSVDQFAQPMETGLAGDARRQAGIQKALGWLSSGATPEDVQFRREQQNLANMGAYIGGRTPQAEFANLSGAQQGATPMRGGAPLPTMNQNAGQSSQQAALNDWQTQMGYEANQANPWMAGLSGLLGVGSAAGKAGWQPLR